MCTFVCGHVFVCVNTILFACLTNYDLPSCATSDVQRGSIYKYFTSAATFFHSICYIMNLANHYTLLPLLDLLLSLQFPSHNSLDLRHVTCLTVIYVTH